MPMSPFTPSGVDATQRSTPRIVIGILEGQFNGRFASASLIATSICGSRPPDRNGMAIRITSVAEPASGPLNLTRMKVRPSILNRASSRWCTMSSDSAPAQSEGSAMTLTRSLRQRRNRATSSARDSLVVFTSHCLVADGLFRLPFSKVGQKLFGRNKERILVRDPADDDKPMCPDDVNYGVAAELLQTTCADDRIAVTAPHIVHAGFEFNQTVQLGAAMGCPIHPANDATQWKPAARTARGQF